jgi:RNA polymerase sigma-70 factor (ECF subfamily)
LLAARSLAIDTIRRRVAESRAYEAGGRPEATDPAPGPADLAVAVDMGERARRAMRVLSDEQRTALELAYFGGRTTAEVAALEGIPVGTAKTRIHHALLRLRTEMAKERTDEV